MFLKFETLWASLSASDFALRASGFALCATTRQDDPTSQESPPVADKPMKAP
jgi:hypothetical protein